MKRNESGEDVDLGLKLLNQNPSFQSHHDGSRSNGQNHNGGDSGPTFNGYNSVSSHSYGVPPPPPFFKHLGERCREEMGYPFTISQWKELERQAMIYKYMLSSLPIPPQLLYSSLPNFATFSSGSYFVGRCRNGLNYMWVGNSKDGEPMRCRRTDGKKWRCSRDVAPNQKYCERHMHRGKPRSRKPVELVFHRRDSLSQVPLNKDISITNTSPTIETRLDDLGCSFPSVSSSKHSAFDHSIISGVTPFDGSQSLVSSDEQQGQQLVQTNMTNQVFQHLLQGESLNLNTYTGFDAKLNMTPLETGNKDNSGIHEVSFSSSYGGNGNAIDKDMCQIHMGLQVIDSWMDSSASPGGPLAEVLRPGSVVTRSTDRSASNLIKSDANEGSFVMPPATTVSSPSGVPCKTLASISDRSGISSLACPSSDANSDVPFHWLN